MRKFLLWFLAALLMTACGGCSATDDKVESIIYINIIKQK